MTPTEYQKKCQEEIGYGAIWLRRELDHFIVAIEYNGKWIDVIREHYDGPASHIVEPAGIKEKIK